MQRRAVTDMAMPSNLESEWGKTKCIQSTGTEYHTQPCVSLEQGPDVDSCEHSNQLSGSLKDGNSLTRLANCSLFRNNPAPWHQSLINVQSLVLTYEPPLVHLWAVNCS
jgi:hypothetical protein